MEIKRNPKIVEFWRSLRLNSDSKIPAEPSRTSQPTRKPLPPLIPIKEPQLSEPQPSESQPSESQPSESQPSEPQLSEPQPSVPQPSVPQPIKLKSELKSEPQPSVPEPIVDLTEIEHDLDLDSIDFQLPWLIGGKILIYQCDTCKLSYKHKQTLERHCQNICDRSGCNIQFKTHIGLLVHLKRHHGVKVFVCHICKKSFSHRKYLLKHMENHPTNKCAKSQKFIKNNHLSDHDYQKTRNPQPHTHLASNVKRVYYKVKSQKVEIKRHSVAVVKNI